MTAPQLNQLTRYRSLAEFLAGQADIIAGIGIMPTIVAEFLANLAAIERDAQVQVSVTAGKTDAKLDAENRLAAMMALIADSLYAWATRTGQLEILAKASMGRWELGRLRDSELSTQAHILLDETTAHSPAIACFGISDAVLQKYREAIACFDEALESRDGSLANRKVTRSDIRALFDATDRLLEDQLDAMVAYFHESHPAFHETYHALRDVRSTAVRHRSAVTPDAPAASGDGNGNGAAPATFAVPVPAADTTATP